MSSKNTSLPLSVPTAQDTKKQSDTVRRSPIPPIGNNGKATGAAPFWRDRLIEGGLILSMGMYYVVGNPNLHIGPLSRVNPLLSLPFLLVFAVLCRYRLSFALALLPLSLPFYLLQKTVVSHYAFSLAEITLWTCLAMACLQLLFKRGNYRFSWSEWRNSLGPFALPILVFFVAAALSIVVAYSRDVALRAFREEVFDPLLYVGLALIYLRSRQDVLRLLAGLAGTGLLVALLGIMQYLFFKHTLALEPDGIRRVSAVYGSANNIGLLLAYVFPLILAFIMGKVSWKSRLFVLVLCVPLLMVLYLSQSHGAETAIGISLLFIAAFSVRNRKYLLVGGVLVVVVFAFSLTFFQTKVFDYFEGHVNQRGINTVSKRFYLWESALEMIQDSPWLGYGMDNWLCHYSKNNICKNNLHHYWITKDPPVTGPITGLSDEPDLSHPHNIFLHVWVSMGVFGLLAFLVVLILFYSLFARILMYLRSNDVERREQLRWMTLGVGAAMLAALVQGQGDSAFLEQDLAFCFWMLVSALLLLRVLSGMPWRATLPQKDHVKA
jgi:O-antigen ligase